MVQDVSEDTPAMIPINILLVIPLGLGSGEILALDMEDRFELPSVSIVDRESSFEAARRAAGELLGVQVQPRRLLYVVEHPGRSISLAVLCELEDEDSGTPDSRAVFIDLPSLDRPFEPDVLREILTEDSASGFYRPTAHVIVQETAAGTTNVHLAW